MGAPQPVQAAPDRGAPQLAQNFPVPTELHAGQATEISVIGEEVIEGFCQPAEGQTSNFMKKKNREYLSELLRFMKIS